MEHLEKLNRLAVFLDQRFPQIPQETHPADVHAIKSIYFNLDGKPHLKTVNFTTPAIFQRKTK